MLVSKLQPCYIWLIRILSEISVDHLQCQELRDLDAVELVFLCAQDRNNTPLWTEFLRRFALKIKFFILGTLQNSANHSLRCEEWIISVDNLKDDLFQDTMLRLVDHDCAVMKRFSGNSDEEVLAYLAAISHSVVLDLFRRQRRRKRNNPGNRINVADINVTAWKGTNGDCPKEASPEHGALTNEIWALSLRTLRHLSRRNQGRNRQIFELYYSKGLSTHDIAADKTIGLSNTAVKKILNGLRDRVRAVASSGSSEQKE